MSTEFHYQDVRITRFFSGPHGKAMYQLHSDVYSAEELKMLRTLIASTLKMKKVTRKRVTKDI